METFIKKLNVNIKELLLVILLLVLIITIYYSESLKSTEKFRITFFDVGQGDATLIETPKNLKILIDGGPDNKISNQLGKHFSFLGNTIDIMVATHSDLDHIFGLIKVLEKYKVKVLFVSLPNSKNELMQKLIQVANSKNVKVVTVESSGVLKIDDGTEIDFLFPTQNMDEVGDTNSASIVTQVIFKNTQSGVPIKILLTGDLPIAGENYLVSLYGDNLKSNILKLGHHGSDTSSSINFLEKVRPSIAIVSASKNNKFCHPHKSVVDLVTNFGAKVLETGKQGNIYFEF